MKKYHIIGYVLALVITTSQQVFGNDFKGFDDNILFSLNFPGNNFVSYSILLISLSKYVIEWHFSY